MKQEPAAESAAEAADDAHPWAWGGGGGSGGSWPGLAAPSSGTSYYDLQRDALVKVETKYDN